MLNHLILAIPGNPVIGEPASAFTYALNSAVLALGFGVTTVLVAFLVRSSLFAVQRMQMRQVVANVLASRKGMFRNVFFSSHQLPVSVTFAVKRFIFIPALASV